jgi:hypothetical protein
MHRTTIMLPGELKAKAARYARKMKLSLGDVIRQSLADWLALPNHRPAKDPLLADEAVFDGPGEDDLSSDHDRYLYGEERDLS